MRESLTPDYRSVGHLRFSLRGILFLEVGLNEIVVWLGACCFFCGWHLERLIGVISIVLRYWLSTCGENQNCVILYNVRMQSTSEQVKRKLQRNFLSILPHVPHSASIWLTPTVIFTPVRPIVILRSLCRNIWPSGCNEDVWPGPRTVSALKISNATARFFSRLGKKQATWSVIM